MKFKELFCIGIITAVLFSCGTKPEEEVKLVSADSTELKAQPKDSVVTDEFELISNIEQISFCLPLPKGEYIKDEKNEYERAKFVFNHKSKKDDQIIMQGLMRADTKINLEDYFNNTYATAEEEGKIIEKKELLKEKNIFYARGYYNNMIYKERFTEIFWVRPDEVVSFTASYSVNDSTLWNQRLNKLLKYSSNCD